MQQVAHWIGTRARAATTLAALIALFTGCAGEESPPWPLEVPPSKELELELRRSWARLDATDPADVVVENLHTYDRLTQDLTVKESRAEASDRMYEVWSSDLENPLWPELVRRQAGNLVNGERVFPLFEEPVCTDTTTAVGAYASAWNYPREEYAILTRGLESAPTLALPSDRFSRFWIQFRTAYAARVKGNYARSVELALQALPDARAIGGRKLESIAWLEIAYSSASLGELDDALHAATVADTLGTLAAPAGGAMTRVLETRYLRAGILAARRDVRAAFRLYESNAELASSLGLDRTAGRSLHAAGTLADAIGDPELTRTLDLRALAIGLAGQDSLNVPRHLMNIGRGYLFEGQPDSCLAYQRRASRWIDAFPTEFNVARMPLLQAEYHLWVGDYDVVDSLLEVAAEYAHIHDGVDAFAEFHIESMKGWMQVGRPDLVYQSIEALSDYRSGVVDAYTDRNVVADLNLLIAEFYTRRGEYALADDALDLAEGALSSRKHPSKDWVLARNRGLLDRARGNPVGAERWFSESLRIGETLQNPDLIATGRLLLGSVRSDAGDYAGAREALPPASLESSESTRVLTLLLRGLTHLREDQAGLATPYLEEAEQTCRSWTSPDLVGRVELEVGRAQALQGDRTRAIEYYDLVADRIRDAHFRSGETEELAYFTGDLRRDLVEARLALERVDARRSLEFAMDVLPRWKPVDGSLRSPQVIFFVGEDTSARWVVHGSGIFHGALPGRSELLDLLDPVLADVANPGRSIEARAVARLSETLLAGLEEFWSGEQTLHFVPDLDLFQVPWAFLHLPDSGPALVIRGPVAVLDRPTGPRDSEPAYGERLLLIAAPGTNNEELETLRYVEQEAAEVLARWASADTDLLTGDTAATAFEPGFDLTPYRAIHIASHARAYTGRSDQTTLLLGGANASSSRIGSLDVPAELVFLSACEAGDGGGTKSMHAGIARSFLDAGARQVVAPISVVDDAAAREFAVSFYENWRPGESVASALRAAQLAQMNGERSHAFYWAFYQVFGVE